MIYTDLFNQVEARINEWLDLESEFGECGGVIRKAVVPEVPATATAGLTLADGALTPCEIVEVHKPTHLFLGRTSMTLVVETYRADNSIITYDPDGFKMFWLKVVYIPWVDPTTVIIGTEKDRPAAPTDDRHDRYRHIAEARRRYDRG